MQSKACHRGEEAPDQPPGGGGPSWGHKLPLLRAPPPQCQHRHVHTQHTAVWTSLGVRWPALVQTERQKHQRVTDRWSQDPTDEHAWASPCVHSKLTGEQWEGMALMKAFVSALPTQWQMLLVPDLFPLPNLSYEAADVGVCCHLRIKRYTSTCCHTSDPKQAPGDTEIISNQLKAIPSPTPYVWARQNPELNSGRVSALTSFFCSYVFLTKCTHISNDKA